MTRVVVGAVILIDAMNWIVGPFILPFINTDYSDPKKSSTMAD
jgi:hypothetical protein